MEYILFLTYRCNLRCKYCFAKNYVQNNKTNHCTVDSEMVDRICRYIENDIIINQRKNNSIVFFGGEPTLVPSIIKETIEKTKHLNLYYSIYTNGLLLDSFPVSLLSKLQTILVAIDGDVACHERYKPKGSYEKIIENVKKIRGLTNAQIIARITMEEETNIDLSVTNLLPSFDFVHWQIVNKSHFNKPEILLSNYRNNVSTLFYRWLDSLRNGVVLNIIPFNRIAYSMITEDYSRSFRCGCGTSTQSIDIYGNVYLCDEYIDSISNSVGNISEEKYNLISYKSHFELNPACGNCEITRICMGRCRKCLETQSKEQISFYCELTKILVHLIQESLDEINACILRNEIPLSSLHSEIYNTEIIP